MGLLPSRLLREGGKRGAPEGEKNQSSHAQCPMPNAQCPMPNAQCPMPYF
ncbi:histidine kinase [Nostoc linckia]|nr:histidine kinase [Nostoc linckia]